MRRIDRPLATVTFGALFILFALTAAATADGRASAPPGSDGVRYGAGLRAGGRYDDVRMCVASGAGTKGGLAAELTVFVELPLWTGGRLQVDLPLLRPVLFGAAFRMLQLEPRATLKVYRGWLVFGPSLGLVLHYGPDFRSENAGAGRGPSFFAVGPSAGGYLGAQWTRPGAWFDLQLGVHPYVAPLFTAGDRPDGVVAGGMLEVDFRLR